MTPVGVGLFIAGMNEAISACQKKREPDQTIFQSDPVLQNQRQYEAAAYSLSVSARYFLSLSADALVSALPSS